MAALHDQQLAGYIMWMPACMIYALVAAVVVATWRHDGAEQDDAATPVPPTRGAGLPIEEKSV